MPRKILDKIKRGVIDNEFKPYFVQKRVVNKNAHHMELLVNTIKNGTRKQTK